MTLEYALAGRRPLKRPRCTSGLRLDITNPSLLIVPKFLKPLRTQLRIAHRVRDVLVLEVLLDRVSVVAFTGELVEQKTRDGILRTLRAIGYFFGRFDDIVLVN